MSVSLEIALDDLCRIVDEAEAGLNEFRDEDGDVTDLVRFYEVRNEWNEQIADAAAAVRDVRTKS